MKERLKIDPAFINWLDKDNGKNAKIFVFCWIALPIAFFFLSLLASLFSRILCVIIILFWLLVFTLMTIGIFLMILLKH